jgi:hypothetical protein
MQTREMDAERRQLELDLDRALADRRRLQPTSNSLPKHFLAFHDAEHRYAEAMERCTHFNDTTDQAGPGPA